MPKKKIEPAQEINQVIKFLCNRNVTLTLRKISRDTGLPTGWLSMLARGKIPDPSYTRFKILKDYLANISL